MISIRFLPIRLLSVLLTILVSGCYSNVTNKIILLWKTGYIQSQSNNTIMKDKLLIRLDLTYILDTVYTLLSEIQKEHLKSSELSNFVLFKNVEDRSEYSLASAYMLYLYKLHKSHISDQELESQRADNYQKMVRYLLCVTNFIQLVSLQPVD